MRDKGYDGIGLESAVRSAEAEDSLSSRGRSQASTCCMSCQQPSHPVSAEARRMGLTVRSKARIQPVVRCNGDSTARAAAFGHQISITPRVERTMVIDPVGWGGIRGQRSWSF